MSATKDQSLEALALTAAQPKRRRHQRPIRQRNICNDRALTSTIGCEAS